MDRDLGTFHILALDPHRLLAAPPLGCQMAIHARVNPILYTKVDHPQSTRIETSDTAGQIKLKNGSVISANFGPFYCQNITYSEKIIISCLFSTFVALIVLK